jgi:hypothetical protein
MTAEEPKGMTVVCWRHKESREEGHGQPVTSELADEYMVRNAPTLPEFEFWVRPAADGELIPQGRQRQKAS